MYPAAQTLHQFWNSPLGRAAQESTHAALQTLPPLPTDARSLVLGFAPPLEDLEPSLFWAMPASMGGFTWPSDDENRSALVYEEQLPFPNTVFDRVYLLHALEFSGNPQAILNECARILRPKGELVCLVANRRSVWARRENSPFAHGNPYSAGQLENLILKAELSPTQTLGALYFPPSKSNWVLRNTAYWAACGRTLCPGLGGMLIQLASKDVIGGTLVPARDMRKVKPVFKPVGV